MRFGFHFMDFTMPGGSAALAPAIAETARAADEIGASWFTVMDHWFQMEAFRTAHDPMLEGYTTLAFAAAQTSRLQLGTIVTGVTYRHPALLAKTVTTLDVLSSGRAFLGIGAAWYEREHLALGVPFPPLAERFERLEEAIQIALQMWSDDEGPYDGKHYHLTETSNVPAPVSQPRPKIVIGGSGERKTLRMVAQYADATNLIVTGPEQAREKLEVLRRHCDNLGRDYDTIEKTVQGPRANPVEDPDGFLRLAQQYADIGIDHIHTRPITPDPVGSVRAFGDVLAQRLTEIN
jgi:F420-dependent oxidoreductase-like protein